MFIKRDGLTKTMSFPKAASTAIAVGDLLVFDGSGHVTPAASTTGTNAIVGVSQQAWASSDATNSPTLVEVPVEKGVEWLADVGAGSPTAALVGTTCDLNDKASVNTGGTSHNPVLITLVISATKVVVVLATPLIL